MALKHWRFTTTNRLVNEQTPPDNLATLPLTRCFAGVDTGGTKIAGGIINAEAVFATRDCGYRRYTAPPYHCQCFEARIPESLSFPGSGVSSGVGSAGQIDYASGRVVLATAACRAGQNLVEERPWHRAWPANLR